MNEGREVVIAGRAFTLGAVYAPRSGRHGHKPCRLLHYAADSLLSGGRVHLALVPSGKECVMTGTAWAAWAGGPVEDDLADMGRR
jgi:hypothetical protein